MQFKRREFISALAGTAAGWPLAARAQQPDRAARVGYLGLMSPAFDRAYGGDDVFAGALRDLGYVEGRNIHIEFRYAEGHEDRLSGLATELVNLNVDVIVTYATGVNAAQRATARIPIVAATAGDMVAMGIVTSLAHPGGNITGSTFFVPELYAKRLELLREVVPSMTRTGVLLVQDNPSNLSILEAMRTTAKALKAELHPIEVRGPTEYESAFSTWANERIGALVVTDHAQFLANIGAIAALVAKHRFPSIGPLELSASGGLMAYGVNFPVMFHRAAVFVDKILKGANPRDIPIEQATKFKLVLNLKAASALGLDIPPILSARADEVIE
jgi:putative tryptophan/tyrosine transport system substrate-binding protein